MISCSSTSKGLESWQNKQLRRKNKINKQDKIHPLFSHLKPNIYQPPHSFHPSPFPTVCFNKTMNCYQAIEFESVGMMENFTYTWDLVQVLESVSPASCRHQPHALIPYTQAINQEGAQNPKNDQVQTNRIVLFWPTYTELRAERGRLGTQPKER